MKLNLNELLELTKNTHICFEKHPDEDLYIFGYYNGGIDKPNVWNELTKMCRGLIVDKEGTILERPFEKFWTYRQYMSEDTLLLSENKMQKIPNVPFRIYEKVDGSMATMYWIKDTPALATQRSFTSPKAKKATEILHKKYSHTFSKFNKKYTYIFEAVYPETSILIDYGNQEELYLIGVIDKETGKAIAVPDIGFPMCKDLTPQYGHIKNYEDLSNLNITNLEGFVIQYENDLRIKIKFPWYKEMSSMKDKLIRGIKNANLNQILLMQKMGIEIQNLSNIQVWECLKNGDKELYEIKAKLTVFHYTAGVEFWLKEQVDLILTNKDWDKEKPQQKIDFKIDLTFETENNLDVMMWNWKDRYLNMLG
ncbi:RNA ligase [Flavobacterium ardleyense]|uniref:RNA ligase n=1 Tax=Flavobacterium ardleyense TaxID=2038737 RepID=A0ABW5ZBX4_9FLAO